MIEAKYKALIEVEIAKISKTIKDYYEGVNLDELRTDSSFIVHVCRLVEDSFTKDRKKYKFDKKNIVMTILKRIITSIQQQDIQTIDSIIEYAHSSGQLIGEKVTKKCVGWGFRVLKKVLMIDSK